MTRAVIAAFALTILLIFSAPLTSCVAPGAIVTVRDVQERTRANGVVVGPKLVLTLGHCVDGAIKGGKLYIIIGGYWVKATIVRVIKGKMDDFVLLRVDKDSDWKKSERWLLNPAGKPAYIYIRNIRNKKRWKGVKIHPGDSGSPIVDSTGRLVGLLYGHWIKDNSAIMERLPKDIFGDDNRQVPRLY